MTLKIGCSPVQKNNLRNTSCVNVRRATKIMLPVLATLMTTAASAQTWTGAESSDWTDAANWSTGVPVDGTTFITTNGVQPILDDAQGSAGTLFLGSASGSTLGVQNGAELTLNTAIIGNSTNNNASGNMLDQQSGTLTLGSASMVTADFLDVGYYGTGTVSF